MNEKAIMGILENHHWLIFGIIIIGMILISLTVINIQLLYKWVIKGFKGFKSQENESKVGSVKGLEIVNSKKSLFQKWKYLKIEFIFAWYDMWIGAFWDKKKRALYVLPLPMVGVVIYWPQARLKVGDVVKGYRHTQYMTIRSVKDDIVTCDYFVWDDFKQETYKIESLIKQ